VSERFCSEVARAEGAPLGGTATRADAWLLVEHPGPWGQRAVEENDLPPAVQEWLGAQLLALGATLGQAVDGGTRPARVRPLLIRREGDRGSRQLACFLAGAGERRQELYRWGVERHDELTTLDLGGWLASGELERWRNQLRLTLVCGNGRRDRCCARWGPPTWRALAAVVGEEAWLSTHQGGHRYAGTGLWLPEGVAHGFLAPTEAAALVEARRRGAVHLPCFRGRTFHAAPAQAADAMLRQETGELALAAWHLAEETEESPGAWRVVFAGTGRRYTVRLRRDSEEVLVSCGPSKVKPIDRFTLTAWESEECVA
jgi:hypothetical protein